MENEPRHKPFNRQPSWFKAAFYGSIALSILFLLAVFTAPMWLRSEKKTNQTQAFSNLRQLGLALFEFEIEYGVLPDSETVEVVTESSPNHGFDLSGRSSNALFRQLFAADITQSEQMFYANVEGSVRPDEDIRGSRLLEPGECGFAYISGLSSTDNLATPIVLTPLIPSTTKFDPKSFNGKAIILGLDNSVITINIDENGNVIVDGVNILSPKHPIWKRKAPVIHYPE